MRPKGLAKTGGRQKGTTNKTSNEIREYYLNLIDENLEQIKSDLQKLEPKERIRIIMELTKFVLPTLKATELTANNSSDKFTPIEITIIGNEEYNEINNKLEARY
jgi:hypothetical protein